jgi:hypothetical protein
VTQSILDIEYGGHSFKRFFVLELASFCGIARNLILSELYSKTIMLIYSDSARGKTLFLQRSKFERFLVFHFFLRTRFTQNGEQITSVVAEFLEVSPSSIQNYFNSETTIRISSHDRFRPCYRS